MDPGQMGAVLVGWTVGGNFPHSWDNLPYPEKYFQKGENNVCIFGKMGYNKME
jgi:hypothetical protein